MAKGIKKFDQEIRVIGNLITMTNMDTSANTSDVALGGGYYVYDNKPWFANQSTTYELANYNSVTANTADIATLSAGTFNISNGVGSGYDIGFDGSIILSAGTDISIVEDGNGKFTINNIAADSANYYLTAATITNGEITYEVKDYGNVTLDLKEKLDLGMLSNVATGGTNDGDFLIWNSATTQWESSGLTEDSLIAGDGINFDTGTVGQVTINSILAGTGGTWKLNADTGDGQYHVLYEDEIKFSGGTNMTVNWNETSKVLTFTNNYVNDYSYAWSLNTINVANTQDVTIQGTANEIEVDTSGNVLTLSLNSTITDNIDGSLSSVTFTSDNDNEHFTYTSVGGTSFDVSVDGTWVRKDGDSMTGDYFVNGNLTITGDTLLVGDLYISGTTVTVDTENLTVADNIIEINANQTGTLGVTNRTSGLIVNRGDLSAYTFAFYEDAVAPGTETEVFRIGETTSDASGNTIDMSKTQVVATRQESNLISDNDLMFWNSSESRLDPIEGTTAPSQDDIALYSGGTWTYYNASALVGGTKSWSTIWDGTNSATTTQANQILTILGGDKLSTTLTGNNNPTLTINHDTVSYTETNASTSALTFISAISFDGYGHVTGFTTETVDLSAYYTGTYIENHFLNTGTSYFTTISADTTSYSATVSGETLTIVGGTGIDTSIDGNGVLTISSDSSENMISDTMGTTSTVLSVDFGAAKVIIIDYYMENGQEGQIRYLSDGTEFTHDYQGTDISISDVSLTTGTLTLTHDSVTNGDDFKYYYKTIL